VLGANRDDNRKGRAYAIEREIRNDQKGRQSNSLIYFDAAYIRAPEDTWNSYLT